MGEVDQGHGERFATWAAGVVAGSGTDSWKESRSSTELRAQRNSSCAVGWMPF